MASGYLTKSDFKVACDCRTRLYYRKQGYPTALDDHSRPIAEGAGVQVPAAEEGKAWERRN
jgi:hypothetical protein